LSASSWKTEGVGGTSPRCPYFAQDERTRESFYVGAALSYLGAGEQLEADLYGVQWGNCLAPAQARAGAPFSVLTRVFNRSRFVWKADVAPGTPSRRRHSQG
jgi:hypothetical protein